jgi:hypothetical protein
VGEIQLDHGGATKDQFAGARRTLQAGGLSLDCGEN